MKRPTEIQILNLKFKIQWLTAKQSGDLKEYGACDREKAAIRISRVLTPEMTATVFLHEVIHAIQFCLDMNPSAVDEEEVAERVSVGLVSVCQQNPNVLKWWNRLLK